MPIKLMTTCTKVSVVIPRIMARASSAGIRVRDESGDPKHTLGLLRLQSPGVAGWRDQPFVR
jgi:hypothetical protein